MQREDIRELEEACEAALAKVVRKHYASPVPARVQHLMAKAAVTVLETYALSDPTSREDSP